MTSLIVNRDWDLLYPPVARRAQICIGLAKGNGFAVDLFEGYRSLDRSRYLYEQGRTRKGKIVTSATAWQSWHNYGLAFDLAFKYDDKWSWDGPWDKVAAIFTNQGFQWLGSIGDKGHYQLTGGLTISLAESLTRMFGVQRLWMELANALPELRT